MILCVHLCYSSQLHRLGIPTNDGSYNVKPKPGGNLPFDFKGDADVDLIVAKADICASTLLEGFDLNICKASFDGKKFHIPDPHLTFAGKTRMEANRRAVVGSYVKHYREPEDSSTMNLLLHITSTIRDMRTDVPNSPFYTFLDAADLPEAEINPQELVNEADRRDEIDPFDLNKLAPIQFHNWCCALIRRLGRFDLIFQFAHA